MKASKPGEKKMAMMRPKNCIFNNSSLSRNIYSYGVKYFEELNGPQICDEFTLVHIQPSPNIINVKLKKVIIKKNVVFFDVEPELVLGTLYNFLTKNFFFKEINKFECQILKKNQIFQIPLL